MVSPLQKRRAVQGVVQAGLCSQRRACRYLGLHRSSHRHPPKQPSEWLLRLHQQIEKLSSKYPTPGLPQADSPPAQRRLAGRTQARAAHPAGVRPAGQTVDEAAPATGLLHRHDPDAGREESTTCGVGTSSVIAPTTAASCASSRSSTSTAASAWRSRSPASSRPPTSSRSWKRLVTQRGAPAHIRSDNGSEFVARTLQSWLAEHHVKTLYIEPASPWQNGHVESFHGSLRDECLDRELMLSVAEAQRRHRGLSKATTTRCVLMAASATAHPLRLAAKPGPWKPILPAVLHQEACSKPRN